MWKTFFSPFPVENPLFFPHLAVDEKILVPQGFDSLFHIPPPLLQLPLKRLYYALIKRKIPPFFFLTESKQNFEILERKCSHAFFL